MKSKLEGFDEAERDLKAQAHYHIAKCVGMVNMLRREPNFATEININGMIIGACDNEAVITMLKCEVREAEKCIEEKENKFE